MQPSRSLRRAANRVLRQHVRSLLAAEDASKRLLPSNPTFSASSDFASPLNASHGLSRTPAMARSACFDRKPSLQRRAYMGLGDGDEDSGLSRHYEETRLIGYTPEQLFAVVAAVDLYQDFVPWCRRSTILRQNDDGLDAELEIGFKFLVERYLSHVKLTRPSLIKTSVSKSNLFDYLINTWEFKSGPHPGTCNLHFCVNFQFKSPLYRHVANMFFNEVVSHLVGSFEGRCNKVYGPSTKILEGAQAA